MQFRRLKSVFAFLRRHPRAVVAAQIVLFVLFMGIIGWAISGSLRGAGERLRDASLVDFALGCAAIAVYYLLFVVGWMKILEVWDIRIGYGVALRAEMISMLAKYVPGGVWTPAARVVAVRRAGPYDVGLVTASVLVEAGLSAIAGVIVFVLSLGWVQDVDAPLAPLIVFALVLVLVLHPRIFQPFASKILRRFGTPELTPIPYSTLIGLLAFYCSTWVIGGGGLFFLLRSVGADPELAMIPFLGGVSAVGAIVAVLSFFAPSGLGPREASMYALMLAITTEAAAVGATVLNRVAITIVEVLLLLFGWLVFRKAEARRREPAPAPARAD